MSLLREQRAYLGLGSNIGDRLENLSDAVRKLDKTKGIAVEKISPVYESDPVDAPGQPDYLNAVLSLSTSLGPHELLDQCLEIERGMGRIRTEKNAARVIDIDIELYGNHVLRTASLSLPHPRMHERLFVLMPLSDIAPDTLHPVSGKTVIELRDSLGHEGIAVFDGSIRF